MNQVMQGGQLVRFLDALLLLAFFACSTGVSELLLGICPLFQSGSLFDLLTL